MEPQRSFDHEPELPPGIDQSIFSPQHESLLGDSPIIGEINALIKRLAPTDLAVLITGETGTGKDICARLLHRLSPRHGKPFIKVNCPSVPEGILEGELFGYERGAFTGAHTSKPGRFELANDGTIFLDEISETSQHIQGKLVQVLDGEPYMRLGGTVPVETNARIVAATNVPIGEDASIGKLRKDISFRLSEVVISIPPLRERREDIPLLAEHFNYNMSKLLNRSYAPMTLEMHAELRKLDWPGNVRELAGRVKKFVATGSAESLLVSDEELASEPLNGKSTLSSVRNSEPETKFRSLKEVARDAAEAAERAAIEETLRFTLWNRRKAAKLLNTSYSSLLRRIEAYKIGK